MTIDGVSPTSGGFHQCIILIVCILKVFFDQVGEHGAILREARLYVHSVLNDGLALLHQLVVFVFLEAKQNVAVVVVIFFLWRDDVRFGPTLIRNNILAHLEDVESVVSKDSRVKHVACRYLELYCVASHPQLLVELGRLLSL